MAQESLPALGSRCAGGPEGPAGHPGGSSPGGVFKLNLLTFCKHKCAGTYFIEKLLNKIKILI